MDLFLSAHGNKITGTISVFDRLIIKGHLPLGYPHGMEQLLQREGKLFKDLKGFVLEQSDRIKERARQLAEQSGRPYEYHNIKIQKDQRAREIAARDGIDEGLVCVFAAVEPCRSFRIAFGEGRPRILPARRKCLFLYYYFIDPLLGFLHARIQTWFPLTIQVYVNGHEWLARQLDARGIGYRRLDNAFLAIDDPAAAQELADGFAHLDWMNVLHGFARRINPLLEDLLAGYAYYWAVSQAEYATNLMFADRLALEGLYPRLLHHATLAMSAEDILTFLGRKLHPCFAGEILNDCTKRWPGARVKHRMKQNWIKMYNKHGSVLRVETVVNNPYEFKVRRKGTRRREEVVGWFPLPKGIAHLFRFAEVARTANRRYLDALAVVRDPTPAFRELDRLARPVRVRGRSLRGFNPLDLEDLHVFRAVLRGENAISGFRNRDVRRQLYPDPHPPHHERALGARVSRLLKRLHVRRLVAKIPRSRRWRVTRLGHDLMAAAIQVRECNFLHALQHART
jgi:hypothetical protein